MTRTAIAGAAAAVLALGAAALASSPALAHHSFAMFDRSKTVTLSGTVKDWQWVNPHSWLQLDVKDPQGHVTEWSIEGRSPNVLERRGWKRTVMNVGDHVTVIIYPMRNGSSAGAFKRLILAGGQQLDADTPTAVDPDEEGPRL